MRKRLTIAVVALLFCGAASAQVFITGLGGSAALSNGAAVSSTPVSASTYDAKLGVAANITAGYHWSDWFSAQGGYIWNQNAIVSTEVTGAIFRQDRLTRRSDALGADFMVYFRSRKSFVRPYLSAGPYWVRLASEDRLGLRVAVGADLSVRRGWALRYTFSEMMTANPLGAGLRPEAKGTLMNFQNLFGIVKAF